MDILARIAVAFALVALTANPTPFSYLSWAVGAVAGQLPLVVLLGLLLLAGWIIFLRASLRSLGPFGMTLVAAIFAAFAWVLTDLGLLRLNDRQAAEWMAIAGLSVVLGTGLAWSHIRRRLSGQADVDDVDER